MTELQSKIALEVQTYSVKCLPLPQPMALAAEAHLTAGQMRRLKSTLKQRKIYKISILHKKADNLLKGRAKFYRTEDTE